jgi:hypothetical protein
MIVNPTPITAATFNGYWITNVQLILGTGKPGILQADLLPYDGQHLLATGGKRVSEVKLVQKATTDAPIAAMLTALNAEITRLSGNADAFNILTVSAPDPAKPVSIAVLWQAIGDKKSASYVIKDAYALAATDPQFAGVFSSTMAAIAGLAGLTVA